MKRHYEFTQYKIKETRTLIITNIKSDDDHTLIKNELKNFGDIRETYTIKDNLNVLFAIFYDIRCSTEARLKLNNTVIGESKISIYFTISKYEIPREGDLCDETKNQGTILLVSRDLETPLSDSEIMSIFSEYGELRMIREYKTYQKFIEFYDSRCTIKAYNSFGEKKYKAGTLMVRYLWDSTKTMRWELIKETDYILRDLRNSSDEEENVKRVKTQSLKKKSVFLRALDDFIADNIEKIDESLKLN